MTPIIVNILAFVAVFFAIFGVNFLLVDLREIERKRTRDRMEKQLRHEQRKRMARDFSEIAAQAMVEDDDEIESTWLERLQFMVEQSGLDYTLQRLFFVAAALAVTIGIIVGLLTFRPLFGVMASLLGPVLVLMFLQFKRRRRLNKLQGQLPDAFELMGRVLRSGQTISQAIQAVAEEFSRPISLEFLYCSEQMNLGLEPEAALRQLGRRTGLLEVKIFVLAVLVHRQTGGNLAELLDKLSGVVRERFRIGGMIRSLTAQGRLQAGILLALPPFMFLLLMSIHREYEMTLLEYPMLIVTALTMMAIGWVWIRKIVNFDY
jgi:tight adherence protein B